MTFMKTTQTPTAKYIKWLWIRIRFFTNIWVRLRFRKSRILLESICHFVY